MTFETLTAGMVPINRIMLVEDEGGICDLLYELLVDAGFEIVQAPTADAAFQLIQQENLKLLLTDINMPGRLDGLSLASIVRESHPGLPIIFHWQT